MKELERYTDRFSAEEDPLLKELEHATGLSVVQPKMMSGHVQGKFLEMLTRMINPRNVLEIGTYTGYSALCFAAGAGSDAVVDTIERHKPDTVGLQEATVAWYNILYCEKSWAKTALLLRHAV